MRAHSPAAAPPAEPAPPQSRLLGQPARHIGGAPPPRSAHAWAAMHTRARARFSSTRRCARNGRDLARKLCHAVRNKPPPTDTAIMAVSTRAPQARARLPRAAPGHFAALALSLRAPARLLARRPPPCPSPSSPRLRESPLLLSSSPITPADTAEHTAPVTDQRQRHELSPEFKSRRPWWGRRLGTPPSPHGGGRA